MNEQVSHVFSFTKADAVPQHRLKTGLYDEIITAFLGQEYEVVIVNLEPSKEAGLLYQGLRQSIIRRNLQPKTRCMLRSGVVYLVNLEYDQSMGGTQT